MAITHNAMLEETVYSDLNREFVRTLMVSTHREMHGEGLGGVAKLLLMVYEEVFPVSVRTSPDALLIPERPLGCASYGKCRELCREDMGVFRRD